MLVRQICHQKANSGAEVSWLWPSEEGISFQVLFVTCRFQIKEKSKRKQFPILRMTKHRLISYHARSFQRIQAEINSKNKYLNRFIPKENIYIS